MKYIAGIFFVITATSLLWAGNREMVEKRVDELDKLNKEAVTRIAGQPESGKINFKGCALIYLAYNLCKTVISFYDSIN